MAHLNLIHDARTSRPPASSPSTPTFPKLGEGESIGDNPTRIEQIRQGSDRCAETPLMTIPISFSAAYRANSSTLPCPQVTIHNDAHRQPLSKSPPPIDLLLARIGGIFLDFDLSAKR
jgi:[protein-PII] uridylyltransferase